MNQFIITRHIRKWLPPKYCVKKVNKASGAEQVVAHAVQRQFGKVRIDARASEEVGGQILFSIKARELLALSFDVADSEDHRIGSLTQDLELSQSWRIVDDQRGTSAQLFGGAVYLCSESEPFPKGSIVCELWRGGGSPSAQLHLHLPDASALDKNLMLSLGILLLLPDGDAAGAGG